MKLIFPKIAAFFLFLNSGIFGQDLSKFIDEQNEEIKKHNWLLPLKDDRVYPINSKSNIHLFKSYKNQFFYFDNNIKYDIPSGYEAVNIGYKAFILSINGKYGLYQDNKFLLPCDFESIQNNINNPNADSILIVSKNGKTQLYSLDKPITCNFEYDSLFFYSKKFSKEFSNYIFFKKGMSFGVCNKKGQLLLPADYNSIEILNNDLFKVKKDNMFIVVNSNNQPITSSSPNLKLVSQRDESLFFEYDNTILVTDLKGLKINQFSKDTIELFDYKTLVSLTGFYHKKTRKYALYNPKSGFLTDFIYKKVILDKKSTAEFFPEGEVPTRPPNYRSGIISNTTGKFISDSTYEYISSIGKDSLSFIAQKRGVPEDKSVLVVKGKEIILNIDILTLRYSPTLVNDILMVKAVSASNLSSYTPDYWIYHIKKNKKIDEKLYKYIHPLKEGRYLALEATTNNLVIPRFYSPSFEYIKDYPAQPLSDFKFGSKIFVWKQGDIYQIYDEYGELYTNDKYESYEMFSKDEKDYFSFKVKGQNIYHFYNSDGDLLDENTSGQLKNNIFENDFRYFLISHIYIDKGSKNTYFGVYDLKNKKELIKPYFAEIKPVSSDGVFIVKSIFKQGIINLNLK